MDNTLYSTLDNTVQNRPTMENTLYITLDNITYQVYNEQNTIQYIGQLVHTSLIMNNTLYSTLDNIYILGLQYATHTAHWTTLYILDL